MKKYNLVLLAMISLLLFSCEKSEVQTVTTMDDEVWADEFDGTSLDLTKWNYDLGTGEWGWGNNELQYYTDREENIKVENGMLVITAHQESYEGSGYTSARINTKGHFSQKYGRIEARMQLPWGQGLWPAFWLLGSDIDQVGWPNCGEIDIMEYRGQEPTVVNGTIHAPEYFGIDGITKSYELQNDRFDTGFHVFGIEWDETFINFYVDDVLYNQITPEDMPDSWVFNKQFYILINLAVGGNYVGSPNENTVFPQTMYVDWVRVYQ